MSAPHAPLFQEVFRRLLARHGRQGWWPVTPLGAAEPQYCGGPRTLRQQLEVVWGAILTQNTAWTNVERALAELRRCSLLSIRGILRAPQAELAQAVRSAGYFNQKALRLKAAAHFLTRHPLKELARLETGEARRRLLQVRGIGPETADSILLYALGKPSFVVDAYTRRIFSRLGLCGEKLSYAELQALFHSGLRCSTRLFNEYHALIVAQGKSICRTKPLCSECALLKLCEFAQTRIRQ